MSTVQREANSWKPLLSGLAIIVFVAGAVYGIWALLQRHALDNTSQSANLGTATSADQTAAEGVLNSFVADARRHDYTQALQATAATYPSPHSPSALTALTQTKLAPLMTGSNLQFEPVHLGSHGRKLFLRAKMDVNGKTYRTVCTLAKVGGAWRISDILPPATRGALGVASTAAISASGGGAPAGGKK